MTIKREDLDRQAVDSPELVTVQLLPWVHPNEILRDEYLLQLQLSVYRTDWALEIPRPRLNATVRGRRGVSADTALSLGGYFGTTPELSINLQTHTIWTLSGGSYGRRPSGRLNRTPRIRIPAPSAAPQWHERCQLTSPITQPNGSNTSTVCRPKPSQGSSQCRHDCESNPK